MIDTSGSIMYNPVRIESTGGGAMKKQVILSVLVIICFSVGMWAGNDEVISGDHIGNIKIGKGNLKIMENADVMGNIFIEEGDLFIGEKVNITGTITIKKGNIFIKENVDILKKITVELGNVTIGEDADVKGDIICKKGVVTLKEDCDIQGNVYAAQLITGENADIHGKFIKTEKK